MSAVDTPDVVITETGKLTPVRVAACCPDCEVELRHGVNGASVMLTVDPPIYMHQCPKCHRAFRLRQPYPTIEYREDT